MFFQVLSDLAYRAGTAKIANHGNEQILALHGTDVLKVLLRREEAPVASWRRRRSIRCKARPTAIAIRCYHHALEGRKADSRPRRQLSALECVVDGGPGTTKHRVHPFDSLQIFIR